MKNGTRHWYGLSDDASSDAWAFTVQPPWLSTLPIVVAPVAAPPAASTHSVAPSPTADAVAIGHAGGAPTAGLTLVFKGVDYVGDVNGSFSMGNSLPTVKSTGANTAAIHVDFGIDATTNTVYENDVAGGFTDTTVQTGATTSVNDEVLAITEAKQAGLTNILVRPLIDFLPDNFDTDPHQSMANPKNGNYYSSEFRAYYNPGAPNSAGANSFFASYKSMIVAQATLAYQNGATTFCIGTELDQLAGTGYLSYWKDIIGAIRTAAPGVKLTYSALWDDPISPWQYGGTGLAAVPGTTVATQISFWNLLDYVGIDEYAPISDMATSTFTPTVTQLAAGWTQAPTDALTNNVTGGASLISYFEGIASATKLPLIFTELGYANSSDAAINPAVPGYDQNGNPDGAVEDQTLQANLYQAFFQAWRTAGNSQLTGVYLWNWEPDATTVGPGKGINYSVQNLSAQQIIANNYTACYAAGTRIATEDGEVAVEDLRAGTMLRTASGALRPVLWIGHRTVDCDTHPRPHDVRPVRVLADAFGPGLPHADLTLSPDHAVFVDGVLIPIRYLLNGRTVAQISQRRVTYYHVELDRHDVLLAQGLPAESYLDTGNRGAFANGGGAVALHPDFGAQAWASQACAPLVTGGATVARVRKRLRETAILLGHVLTEGSGLHAFVDGHPMAIDRSAPVWRIALPAGARRLRLVSATAIPAEVDPQASDHRNLGIGLCWLAVGSTPVPIDDARLVSGWHAPERSADGAEWRWTQGDAVIELDGLTEAAASLELELLPGLRYWTKPAAFRRAG